MVHSVMNPVRETTIGLKSSDSSSIYWKDVHLSWWFCEGQPLQNYDLRIIPASMNQNRWRHRRTTVSRFHVSVDLL